jgi:hypothetical protein
MYGPFSRKYLFSNSRDNVNFMLQKLHPGCWRNGKLKIPPPPNFPGIQNFTGVIAKITRFLLFVQKFLPYFEAEKVPLFRKKTSMRPPESLEWGEGLLQVSFAGLKMYLLRTFI